MKRYILYVQNYSTIFSLNFMERGIAEEILATSNCACVITPVHTCVRTYYATRVQLRVERWAKVVVGGKCTKEGGMQAEVGTNAKSFNEFE